MALARTAHRLDLAGMDSHRLPALFLSHGSPTLALDDSPAGRFLDGLGTTLPRPDAIVVASAHFASPVTAIGAAVAPTTVHDFGGFPEALYRLRYPAPGAPELAADIARRLAGAGLQGSIVSDNGLDHGVWVPLLRMFPQADIPVVPLSVDPRGDAPAHFAVGRALASLRDQNVLVIGSGGFVHNLGDLDWRHKDAPEPEWAQAFADWMRERLTTHDVPALLDWRNQAPHAHRAHPTIEHLLPLFVALGAGGDAASMRTLHRSHEMGSLVLDAFAFD